MGLLIDGVWHDAWYDTEKTEGRFERPSTVFHGRIERGDKHPPEAGRYHLYVSLARPWAHRTLIRRKLKRLEDVISVSVVHPYMGSDGWSFDADYPDATGDTLYGTRLLLEVYSKAVPVYTGRVTVPVRWDKQAQTIVNNESVELVHILYRDFNDFFDASLDLYPAA